MIEKEDPILVLLVTFQVTTFIKSKVMVVVIDSVWEKELGDVFNSKEFDILMRCIDKEYEYRVIYPKKEDIFNAFNLCRYEDLKVVILGQDPYFNESQAHGLAFSVHDGVPLPPSLRNIFKEIYHEFNEDFRDIDNGDLTYLARQGVLLLNSILTVEGGLPLSHSKNFGSDGNIIKWEMITDMVISTICNKKKHIVYLLWGNFAKSKEYLINKDDNLVLKSGHPSPLSARYFFGNNHFIKTNEYLKQHNIKEIRWVR